MTLGQGCLSRPPLPRDVPSSAALNSDAFELVLAEIVGNMQLDSGLAADSRRRQDSHMHQLVKAEWLKIGSVARRKGLFEAGTAADDMAFLVLVKVLGWTEY